MDQFFPAVSVVHVSRFFKIYHQKQGVSSSKETPKTKKKSYPAGLSPSFDLLERVGWWTGK